MTAATGVGSHPGEDQRAFDEAVRVVLGEVPELPYLPEVPGRGAHATMTGRTVAVLSGLAADLQPAGWRLTDASGVDHRRAVSLLGQDLDRFEEETQGFPGTVKVQVVGPWTLAATVERPRGDRVLADHGARRELAQSLAEGLGEHVGALQRRVPGATFVVQLDEPALPAVLAGAVPTASGFHRHRSVDAPLAAPALEWVVEAIRAAGAEPVVHCCADDVPFDLLTRAGAPGLSVDLDRLRPEGYDEVAAALEAGRRVLLGVVPSTRPTAEPTERSVTERVERFLDMLGLEPAANLGLTPACGLAGADPAWARKALALCRAAAKDLS
ncbi:MAG TPA: methionine synthase [Marmoricola sp.]|nr:methionine synthase [Marmoricola sp.]